MVTTISQAHATGLFKLRPTIAKSYMRVDGHFTVWLPQDKRTWRVDDKYGQPVCGNDGQPRRFYSCEAAMAFAANL